MIRSIHGIPTSPVLGMLAICAVATVLSCSADEPSAPDSALKIERLTPTPVEAVAGSTVSASPAVRVTNSQTGLAVEGVKVEFRVSDGAGSVENQFATTNASGIATSGNWVVGTHSGLHSLVAIVGAQTAVFALIIQPDVATRFVLSRPLSVVGATDEVIDGPTVVAYDRFGNRVPGVAVSFTVVSGNGFLQNSTQVTDVGGVASSGSWVLGPTSGENAIIASANGVESLKVSALAVDSKSLTELNLESVRQGTTLREPQAAGILESRLRITPFDHCLCQIQTGYYIINVNYTASPSVETPRIAGEFELVPPKLELRAPQISSATFVDDRIEIVVERDDLDWRWTETWIFR